jgi:hypothetical protein
MLSTEGTSKRQNMNKFDFNPKWSWGYAHGGDFVEQLSVLTLAGIRIRGGGVFLNPGNFRFSALGGLSRRATSSNAGEKSFKRNIYGMKVGYGKHNSSFVDLLLLKVSDDANSALFEVDTLISEDSLQRSDINPEAVLPGENIVAGIASELRFGNRALFNNEIAGSIHTRNIESSELTKSDIPSWVKKIYTPRLGTTVDYAHISELTIMLRNLDVVTGFKYIGPGYISLGLASNLSDTREIMAGSSYKARKFNVRVNIVRQNDNLIKQKEFTTVRNRFNGSVAVRPARWINFTFTGNYLKMTNDAANDTILIDYRNIVFGFNTVATQFHRKIQSVSLNYTYQNSSDNNELRSGSGSRSNNLGFRMSIEINKGVILTPSYGLIRNRLSEGGWETSNIVGVAANYSALDRRLPVNASINMVSRDGTKTFGSNLSSTYKISRLTDVKLEFRFNNVRVDQSGNDYDEYISRLIIKHKF